MGKPWIGFLAAALLFISGALEWAGGHPRLGIFLMVLSVVSFILRTYMIRKMNGRS